MRASNHLLALLLSALACAAQAEVVEISWDSTGRFEKTGVLLAGTFTELCGPLAKGQKVAWSFKSEAPVNFNIHYHEGEQVSYPVKQTGVTVAQGSLDVGEPQDYCWMWSNKGTVPTSLHLTLQR